MHNNAISFMRWASDTQPLPPIRPLMDVSLMGALLAITGLRAAERDYQRDGWTLHADAAEALHTEMTRLLMTLDLDHWDDASELGLIAQFTAYLHQLPDPEASLPRVHHAAPPARAD